MMFIRHHYNCSRNDSDFWKEYKSMELSDELKQIYDIHRNRKNIFDILGIINKRINFTLDQYMLVYKNNFVKNDSIKYLI